MPIITEFTSVRNVKIRYYAIKYYLHGDENVFYILSKNEDGALKSFFEKQELADNILNYEDIISIKEIEILHPN